MNTLKLTRKLWPEGVYVTGTNGYLNTKVVDGHGESWVPTVSDLLANDWYEVIEKPKECQCQCHNPTIETPEQEPPTMGMGY